jgi:integrase
MKTTRAGYQHGSIKREARKHGPAVWTLRWRESKPDGSITRRKEIIGTVEQFRTKVEAWKASESQRTNMNREIRIPRTVAELVTHYSEKELPNKTPYTAEVYRGYIDKWLLPTWGTHSLSDVKTVAFESWLGTLPLANGTRAKLRNILSAIYSHGQRWEFTDRNPITLVRQSAKRENAPCVLDAEEIRALLAELTGVHRIMVFLACTTGLRVSELLGLRWSDCDFEAGEIRLTRGIVRQRETLMKTEASRKPIPLDSGLASFLMGWRAQCAYNQPGDYLFASGQKDGRQPIWPNTAMERHIRPAANRAGIGKHIGWHTFRHSFGTLVKNQGADVATTQALMRHANVSVTMDRYVQAVTPAKLQAQRGLVGLLDPNGPTPDGRCVVSY